MKLATLKSSSRDGVLVVVNRNLTLCLAVPAIARTRDGGLHRRTLEAPLVDDAYPAARLRVDGEWATIEFSGSEPRRVALDGTLDARPR